MSRISIALVAALCLSSVCRAQSEACCLPDGSCLDVPAILCDLLYQGEPRGAGSTCADGACGGACLIDETCVESPSLAECAAAGGDFQGVGSTCAEVIGACCTVDGCVEGTTESGCEQVYGIWQGAGTGCADVDCPALGACCIAETAECLEATTEDECVSGSIGTGSWQGEGSSCADVACPSFGFGACCLGGDECWDFIEESECLFVYGGVFSGGESCSTTVCCNWDIDHSGDVGFADVLAVLSHWGWCGGCPEDLDGDSFVGFDDLLAVLSHWGPCG